ncbi:T9SS type A sorting domain-containing protein [Flavobacterium sp. XS1P32]
MLGSKVLEEKNKNVINISNLESGMYLISITTEKGNCNKKFIKK